LKADYHLERFKVREIRGMADGSIRSIVDIWNKEGGKPYSICMYGAHLSSPILALGSAALNAV